MKRLRNRTDAERGFYTIPLKARVKKHECKTESVDFRILVGYRLAVSMAGFMSALLLTFMPNLNPWNGIEVYAAGFKPIQVLGTVIPGIESKNLIAALVIPVCVLSMLPGLSVLMPFAGLVWFLCLTAGFIKAALHFRRLLKAD